MGTRLGVFWQYWVWPSPISSARHCIPLCPIPSARHCILLCPRHPTSSYLQMELTSNHKKSTAGGLLGFGRIQSNLPPISRLAFDYVDDKDCKQNSLSLLINSLRRTLKIFNYTVWKAAVTRSAWLGSALLSLSTWMKYFLVFPASHT